MENKRLPRCPLIGADGNIFNIFALASRTLKRNGMADKVEEMLERAKAPGNDYHMALGVVFEYVTPVGVNDSHDLNGPNPIQCGGGDEDYDENKAVIPGQELR